MPNIKVSDITAQDAKKIIELAEADRMESQYSLGLLYNNGAGGLAVDKVKAREWFRKAALQGFSEAQYDIGYYYYYGIGGEKDFAKGVMWMQLSAAQGNPRGLEAMEKIDDSILGHRLPIESNLSSKETIEFAQIIDSFLPPSRNDSSTSKPSKDDFDLG